MSFLKNLKRERNQAKERGYKDGLASEYRNPYSHYYETTLHALYEANWDKGQDEALMVEDY